MLPSHSSPSAKITSLPLIRGEPSLRSVASVLWTNASRNSCASAVSAGASASIALQDATRAAYALSGRASMAVVAWLGALRTAAGVCHVAERHH
jgi:hypothetical protein